MNIVAADDDPIALDLLKLSLEADGHRVECAQDGEQAFELLQKGTAVVLISDWSMPRLDGPSLCRRIRATDLGRYIYTILLTARDRREGLVQGLSAGADDFLSKPFEPDELRVRLLVAERIASLETRDLAIFALAKLAESRDRETGGHLERTRAYCRALAQHLSTLPSHAHEVTPAFVRLIYETCPLHDIGKVGIPDHVLKKPGRLTDAEFEIMKSHATIGADTLAAALERHPNVPFLRMARDIALTHHERWDGRGYPQGLRGEQIPLAGRIMALADVYDALRSPRVYKRDFSHPDARDLFLRESGKQFDPAIVQAFLAVEAQFQQLALQHRDDRPALAA